MKKRRIYKDAMSVKGTGFRDLNQTREGQLGGGRGWASSTKIRRSKTRSCSRTLIQEIHPNKWKRKVVLTTKATGKKKSPRRGRRKSKDPKPIRISLWWC